MNLGVTTYDPTATVADKAIHLTATAIAHIKKEITKQKAQGLRLGVKKAGCSGLKYVVDYVFTVNSADQVFTFADDLAVYVDQESLSALAGLTIDYVQEGLNGRLKFINPNEKNSCGCGESFTV